MGPILFIMSINDLLETFPSAYAYADDTVLFTQAPDPSLSIQQANQLLTKVQDWYNNHNLTLNISKTQFLLLTNKNNNTTATTCLTCKNVSIPPSSSIKLLGVEIDSRLAYTNHISDLTKKANKLIYLLAKTRRFLTTEQALTTYTSIIRPILEYCPTLLLNLSLKLSRTIELLQNNAIRIITRAPRILPLTCSRTILNLHTLHSRRKYLFHKFISSKFIKGKASIYLLNLCFQHCTRNLATRSQHKIVKPYYRTKTGQSSFLAHLHNSLQALNVQPKAYLSFTQP